MRKYLMTAFFAALLAVCVTSIESNVLAADAASVSEVTSSADSGAKSADLSPAPTHLDAGTVAGGNSVKDPPEKQKWWQSLIYDFVFEWVVPTFLPVLLALLGWLLRKWGLKIENERIEAIGKSAAEYAEQKGAEWLKENGEKSDKAKKEAWAWELVSSVDKKLKGSEKLRVYMLSKIPDAELKVGEAASLKPILEEEG